MPTAHKPISLMPGMGGRLATDVSANEVGLSNYRVKRDWRRFNDRELRREGHDWFCPNMTVNAAGQRLLAGEPVILLHTAKSPDGQNALLAATATRIWRYFTSTEKYVEDLGPWFYYDPGAAYAPYMAQSGANTPYVLENPNSSPYYDPPYVEDASAGWRLIGKGFARSGNRWEVSDLGGDTVLNNGVDLPVAYRLNEFEVTSLYELRENGVASVGTICEFNSVLLEADVVQLREDKVASVLNNVRLEGTASQAGALSSGATQGTQLPVENVVRLVAGPGSFVFDNWMVGHVLRFTNGFARSIVSVTSANEAVLNGPAPVMEGPYVGNIALRFYILGGGNVDRVVIFSRPVVDASMLGQTLFWDNGAVRRVTAILGVNEVEVEGDLPVAEGPLEMTNPKAYGAVTAPELVDRRRYRVIWSALGDARRYAAEVPASIESGTRTLVFDFPVRSFVAGQAIIVVGAGMSGGNLLAKIVSVGQAGRRATLDTAAQTTVTGALVQAQDMIGSIVGFDDLEEDGSRIIRMLPLNDRLVLYRETGYQFGAYVGVPTAPWYFPQMVKTANALFYKHSLITVTQRGVNFHLFAGANSFFRFDMYTRLPTEWGQDCRRTFFGEAAKGLDFFGTNLVPADAAYGPIYVTPVVVGERYRYEAGGNEVRAENGGVVVNSGSEFEAVSTEFLLLGEPDEPVTGRLRVVHRRTDYIFAADNAVTKEIFICFPSESEDKALCFDYQQGTLSTTGASYTAAETVLRPGSESEKWFVLGTMAGEVLLYGKTDLALEQWAGASAIYHRSGQVYRSELYSGLGHFGAPAHEKALDRYILEASSFSPDTVMRVELYGAPNPNAPERLLAARDLQVDRNLFPVHYAEYYFADRIVVDGRDNPCEISVRTFNVGVMRTTGMGKGKVGA